MRPGLFGFSAIEQGMLVPSKRRLGRILYAGSSLTPGAGSFTATTRCAVEVGIIGAGGSGSDLSAAAGDGGGAAYKRFKMSPGQTFSWDLGSGGVAPSNGDGNPGGDTILTLPSGQVVKALGGGANGGPPGAGVGGDLNRTGGNGGSGAAGSDGEQGGDGGGSAGGSGGGGGAAGFNDLAPLFRPGSGATDATTTGIDPGGGGCGNTGGGGTAGRGGHGGIYFIVIAA